MTPVVINITGLQSADILAFFRKYSVEQHLRQLIDDFMPTFYLTGDDPRDVERDNPKDTAVYDGELDYEVPGDGRLYKNVNNEQYSFDVEEEELIPPSAEETEKYYIITNHFSFYALFEKAVLKQQNVAKDKIITTIYQFPGSEKSLFKTIYQDCDLFLENVSNSSLYENFPNFRAAILDLIDFLEFRYKLFCPKRNSFSNLVVALPLNEGLTIKRSDFEELETQIGVYYSWNKKKYFVIEGTLADILYKLSTQTQDKYKFTITIKPYKNFYYLLSVLKKATPIDLDLLNESDCFIINGGRFLNRHMRAYPSAAERAFRVIIDKWFLTLRSR